MPRLPMLRRSLRTRALAVLLCAVATACTMPSKMCILSSVPCNPPVVDTSVRKPCQTQIAFIRDLSLARINPEFAPKDTTMPLCAASPQSVIVLEYKLHHQNSIRQAAAPFDLKAASPDFSDLQDILDHMEETPYVLQDVRSYMVRVKPGMLEAKTLKTRDGAWNRMYSRANRLPTLEETRIGIKLLNFFIDHRQRDAAYLTLENTKQALAQASGEFPQEKELIAERSQALEELEALLKSTLPYKL